MASWRDISQVVNPGYRRSTLALVALLSALLTGSFLIFFILHNLSKSKDELNSRGEIIARLLVNTVQTPVYAGNKEEVRHQILSFAHTKDLVGITVFTPNGSEYVAEQFIPLKKPDVIAVYADITLDQSLSPDAAIAGIDPGEIPIGKILVLMDYGARKRESMHAAVGILGAGTLVWFVITYLGYLLMRRLTSSLDQLVEGMANIEQGEATQIEVDYKDEEIVYLVGAINRMSDTLIEREADNISLQQQLLRELESRAAYAEETMHAKLAEANRLSSLGTMASYMAHEINNPVGTMIINLDLIKDVFDDSQDIYAEYQKTNGDFMLGGLDYNDFGNTMPYIVEEMQNGAQRIRKIVEDLKRFAKKETAEIQENTDLNKVVMSAIRLTTRSIRSSTNSFEVDLSDPLPPIRGNTIQLEQVMVNLIINACQALPDMDRKLLIRSFENIEEKKNVLIVKDEGTGIDASLLPRLTDPFFTTKTNQGGSGIGLAITSKIIEEHEGNIKFESAPGEGMTVTISFPINEEAWGLGK